MTIPLKVIVPMDASIIEHNGESRIALKFEYHQVQISVIKRAGGKWSNTLRAWHIADKPGYRKQFFENESNLFEIEKFRTWLQANRYSKNTIRTYIDGMKIFANWMKDKNPALITNDEINIFFKEYAHDNHLSISWQRLIVNALKLYFRTIEKRLVNVDLLVSPRKDRKLPNVLSKEEVKKILETTRNLKHKAMLTITYACGLRCSEVVALKASDFDKERMLLYIRSAKGRRDRVVPLSNKLLNLLREYYKAYKPKFFLFEGQNGNERYSKRSLQQVLNQSIGRAGIKKSVTLHWLRHSYATHLLESGTDIRYIQELLGHNSSKTTEIYTHVSNKAISRIRSPFDDL